MTSELKLDDQVLALRPDARVDLFASRRRFLDAVCTQHLDHELSTRLALASHSRSDIDVASVAPEREFRQYLRLQVLVYMRCLCSLDQSASFDELEAGAPHHDSLLAQTRKPVRVQSGSAPLEENAETDRSVRERRHRFAHTPETRTQSKEPSK